jgi:hypothetical protein
MKMMYEVKKLYPYQGFMGVKLKNYEVMKSFDEGRNLVIKFGENKMTISNKEIKSRVVDKSEVISSKLYPGTYYSLWGFKWVPDIKKSLEEETLVMIKEGKI